ncbi:hypothetical protein K2Z83_13525 [Oscillochloris sp. ZM17-4]|uniref:hypothetical protein n=1 Tax=Oscillochloris sp. ZM17-4 TaxID=2866714 RepID=UPI001C72BD49|nr:hypothetical protein [Oscillochloris sp. ZM17-4]MBX0328697.1 hypothetical protein [Oscillochloris sp. ZM17-4]
MTIDAAFVRALRAADLERGSNLPYDDEAQAAELTRLVARLRRMTAETASTSEYTDEDLATAINEDRVTDTTTRLSATGAVDTRYTPLPVTYDLNATAARIWDEKISALVGAGTYDYSADGQSYSLSQVVQQYHQRRAYYASRRRVKSARMVAKKAASTEIEPLNGRL